MSSFFTMIIFITASSLSSINAFGGPPDSNPPQLPKKCPDLLATHASNLNFFTSFTDEQVLHWMRDSYPEEMTMLSQVASPSDAKANANPDSTGNMDLGPNKIQRPSLSLYGRYIASVDQTAVAILSLKWILAGDYEALTANQIPANKLSIESFSKLRGVISSIIKTPEDLNAIVIAILPNDLKAFQSDYSNATSKTPHAADDELWLRKFDTWSQGHPRFNKLDTGWKNRIFRTLQMKSQTDVIRRVTRTNSAMMYFEEAPRVIQDWNSFQFMLIKELLIWAGDRGDWDPNGAKLLWEFIVHGKLSMLDILNRLTHQQPLGPEDLRLLEREKNSIAFIDRSLELQRTQNPGFLQPTPDELDRFRK